MSEIVDSVTLTNYFDLRLKEPQVRSVKTECVIDPKVISLMLPASLVEKLGLLVAHKQTTRLPDLSWQEVTVTFPVMIELQGRKTTEEAIIWGEQVRIGRTILAKTDLVIDNGQQSVAPNPAHFGQVIIKV